MREELIEKYTNGSCNIFALALAEIEPSLKVSVHYTHLINNESPTGLREIISHAWCEDEKGIIYDVRGSSVKNFGEDIEEANSLMLKGFYEGIDCFVVKDAYSDLSEWTTFYLKSSKKLRKRIEKAKNQILKSSYRKDYLC